MPTYKILEQDSVLLSQPLLIKKFGRIKAQFLSQLHYWQTKGQGVVHNELHWIYNTAEEWSEQLQISIRHFKRIIKELYDEKIIFIEKLATHKYNRTNYYSLNYNNLIGSFKEKRKEGSAITIAKDLVEKSHSDKMTLSSGQNGPIYTKNTTKNQKLSIEDNLPKTSSNTSQPVKNIPISKVLLNKWNEIIGEESEQILTLNKKRAQWLVGAFKHKFQSSLELWEKFCNLIKSSDFLMGRIKKTFKIMLEWAVKFDIIDRILEGQFGVNLNSIPEETPKLEDNLEVINQSSESELVKTAQKNILQAIGSCQYTSWFSKAFFQEVEGKVYMFADNGWAESHIQENYMKLLQKLEIKLLERKWLNYPLTELIETFSLVENAASDRFDIKQLHQDILAKVGPSQYKKWFYKQEYKRVGWGQFEMKIDNYDDQVYIETHYQNLCTTLGIKAKGVDREIIRRAALFKVRAGEGFK